MPDTPKSKPKAENHGKGEQRAGPVAVEVTAAQKAADATSNTTTNISFYQRHKLVLDIVIALVTVGSIVVAILLWIEDRIEKTVEQKLSDVSILRKIAAEARPVLIFDADGKFVSDAGAIQFVKDIKILGRQPDLNDTNMPRTIRIEFTKYFQNAPILTPISQNGSFVSSRRKEGFVWEWDIFWPTVIVPGLDSSKNQFRLELLP